MRGHTHPPGHTNSHTLLGKHMPDGLILTAMIYKTCSFYVCVCCVCVNAACRFLFPDTQTIGGEFKVIFVALSLSGPLTSHPSLHFIVFAFSPFAQKYIKITTTILFSLILIYVIKRSMLFPRSMASEYCPLGKN